METASQQQTKGLPTTCSLFGGSKAQILLIVVFTKPHDYYFSSEFSTDGWTYCIHVISPLCPPSSPPATSSAYHSKSTLPFTLSHIKSMNSNAHSIPNISYDSVTILMGI